MTLKLKLGIIIVLVGSLLSAALALHVRHAGVVTLQSQSRTHALALGEMAAQVLSEQDRELLQQARAALLSQAEASVSLLDAVTEKGPQPGLARDALTAWQQSPAATHLTSRLASILQGDDNAATRAYVVTLMPGADVERAVLMLADSIAQPYDPAEPGNAQNQSGFLVPGSDAMRDALNSGLVQVTRQPYGEATNAVLVPLAGSAARAQNALVLVFSGASVEAAADIAYGWGFQVLLAGIVISLIIAVVVIGLISPPLYHLSVGVGRLQAGDYNHPIPLQGRDEWAELAHGLNTLSERVAADSQSARQQLADRDQALAETRSEVDRLSRLLKDENQDLGTERALLMQLRQASFPDAARLASFKGWDIALHYQLSGRLAGEFFDIIRGPQDQVWFCFGSVSGYGVETSLMALQVNATLSGLLKLLDVDAEPAAVMARLNRELVDANTRFGFDRHVKLLLVGQQGSRNVVFTGQYENPWMFRAGGAEQTLDTLSLGVPLGVSPDTDSAFKPLSVNLEGTDVLVLLSSGWLALFDQQAGNLERQLKKLIKLNVTQSSEDLQALILKAMEPVLHEVRKAGASYPDDLALVVVKRKVAG